MMRKNIAVTIVLLLVSHILYAQNYIEPKHLEVSQTQTTNLVFPSSILSVDRGSERIVVQKSTSSVLRVKAESSFTDTTNLTVITTDGKLYSFLVHYTKYPVNLNINLSGSQLNGDTVYAGLAKKTSFLKHNLYGIGVTESRVHLSLVGIYSTGEEVICKMKIENNSSLSYAMGSLRCYSSERNTSRRRSSQDREVIPLYLSSNDFVIRENSFQLITIVLAKPSLVSARRLVIDLSEKDGDRNLSLAVANRYLLKAIFLPR